MKVRLGFVSNSSSSSFTCDVSGNTESGWDLCLSDAGMFECTAGHTVCDSYKLEDVPIEKVKSELIADLSADQYDETKAETDEDRERYARWNKEVHERNEKEIKIIQEFEGDDVDELLEALYDGNMDEGETPTVFCPLCQLTKLESHSMLRYLLVKAGHTHEEVVKEIQGQFSNLGALNTYINAQNELIKKEEEGT